MTQVDGQLRAQTLNEFRATILPAPLVRKSATGDANQPKASLTLRGKIVEAAPGDEECLGENVGGILGIGNPTKRVGEDLATVFGVELAKADFGKLVGK